MDFFKKLMDGFKNVFSSIGNSLSSGFANFSFASLFSFGSAQGATPPQPPQHPAYTAVQPQVAPGMTPTARPSYRQQGYTEAGPNGTSVHVNPAQYETNRPYMGANGPDRGGIGFMRPFQQETAERAAFNPHNPNAVQHRMMDVLGGRAMASVGNNPALSAIVGGVFTAARYDMGRNVPDARGQFGQAAGYAGTPGFNPALGAPTVGQAIIQDSINTAIVNAIPQHSHPGGAFGALLGKLGR